MFRLYIAERSLQTVEAAGAVFANGFHPQEMGGDINQQDPHGQLPIDIVMNGPL